MAKFRPSCDAFTVSDMAGALAVYANMKKCPFDWEIKAYGSKRRKQGPDREGLAKYHKLLSVILDFAPGCFPAHLGLHEVWKQLNSEQNIMNADMVRQGKSVFEWASEAANEVRTCLKHVLDLKRAKTPWVSAEVAALMEKAVGPRSRSRSSLDGGSLDEQEQEQEQEQPLPGPLQLAPLPGPRLLAAHTSEASSVIFCGASCNCPECRPVVVVTDETSSPTSTRSPTSLAAEGTEDTQ